MPTVPSRDMPIDNRDKADKPEHVLYERLREYFLEDERAVIHWHSRYLNPKGTFLIENGGFRSSDGEAK